MKRWLVPFTLSAIAGLLLPFDPASVHACICNSLTASEMAAEADAIVVGVVSDVQYMGPVDEIAATFAVRQGVSTDDVKAEIVIDAERHLKGEDAAALRVRQRGPVHLSKDLRGELKIWITGGSNCQVFDTTGGKRVGDRYILFLRELEDGAFSTSTCSGSIWLGPHPDTKGPIDNSAYWDQRYAEYDAALDLLPGTLVAIANSTPPPTERKDSSFPAVPVAAAALLGPLAFLAGAAFLWRRGV